MYSQTCDNGSAITATRTNVLATCTNVTSLVPLFNGGSAGLVPTSLGGTANFLRSDGTWVAPSSAISYPLTDPTFTGTLSGPLVNATGGIEITGSGSLPTATNSGLWMASGLPSPVVGRIYIGDGSGLSLSFAKRTGGVDTEVMHFIDDGTAVFDGGMITEGSVTGIGLNINGSSSISTLNGTLGVVGSIWTAANFDTPDGGYCFGGSTVSAVPVICMWSDNATNMHLGDAAKSDPSNIALTLNGLAVTGSSATFASRPTFGTATPWDSANFNPAGILPLTGGTITGNLTVSGTLAGNFAISSQGVISGASLNTTGAHGAPLQGINDSGDLSVTGTSTLSGVAATSLSMANGPISAGTITGTSFVGITAAAIPFAAPLASPAFTGTPTAPTATAGTNTTQVATTAYVQNAVSTAATLVFGTITILPGDAEGNDSSHSNLSITSVCVASAMNPTSPTPVNPTPWDFLINLSPSNISIIATGPTPNVMLQKQIYSYMCRP